tara:strand:- start:49 stop:399 length:351 start_codon:yes stop_codon:yes gene_type:complete
VEQEIHNRAQVEIVHGEAAEAEVLLLLVQMVHQQEVQAELEQQTQLQVHQSHFQVVVAEELMAILPEVMAVQMQEVVLHQVQTLQLLQQIEAVAEVATEVLVQVLVQEQQAVQELL